MFQSLNLKNNHFGPKDIDFVTSKIKDQIVLEINNESYFTNINDHSIEDLIKNNDLKQESSLVELNVSKNCLRGCNIGEFIKYLQLYCKLSKINVNNC